MSIDKVVQEENYFDFRKVEEELKATFNIHQARFCFLPFHQSSQIGMKNERTLFIMEKANQRGCKIYPYINGIISHDDLTNCLTDQISKSLMIFYEMG